MILSCLKKKVVCEGKSETYHFFACYLPSYATGKVWMRLGPTRFFNLKKNKK